jgi:hypothetical protein
VSRGARKAIEQALEYLSDEDTQHFHPSIMTTLLNGETNGLFYAHLAEKAGDPIIFEIDPYDAEEVKLLRRAKLIRDGGLIGRPQTPAEEPSEIMSQFHLAGDYESGLDLTDEDRNPASATGYRMELNIEDDLDFSAVAEVDLLSKTPDLDWMALGLFPELVVDSAFWAAGEPATFFRGEENGLLWVEFDPGLGVGETRTLQLHYQGDLLVREGDWILLLSSSGWYPRYTFEPATFDVTVHSPTKFKFVSAGDKVMEQRDGDVLTTRWVTPQPIMHSSFNIGVFDQYDVDFPGVPPTTVLMATEAHQALQTLYLSGATTIQEVGADVTNSIRFFTELFGEPLAKRFYATEIPFGHGQAFPGMVHLSWITFHETREEGEDEAFRAHEMAHQWWGLGVTFKTYHDQWLDEGLAEFSGAWYVEDMLNKWDLYVDMFERYRENIEDRRDEAGPLWLGRRLATSETPRDYSIIAYEKGAWVFNMLRYLMRDPQTGSDEGFKQMLRDYYGTYRGKGASTEDFRGIVEKHMGMQMDWFFNQWVYGTDFPTYEFSYLVEEDEAGMYPIKVRIRQVGVPEDFRMYLPLQLDFEDGASMKVQVFVTGELTEGELPPMTREPTKLVLIPSEEVLATVKNVRWQ